jgi:hypothetical protein
LIYTIDKIELHYSDMYRDGFLGPYFLVRDFFLVGSIGKDIGGKFTAVPFRFEYRDSIALTARDSIEYGGYQLTQAPLPKEPVFQSLVEPIVAVTAFAAAIYLFFTVRKSN